MIDRRAISTMVIAGYVAICLAASTSGRAQDPQTQAEPPAASGAKENVQMPRAINAPDPPYPPEARAKNIQGAVVLRVVIGTDGTAKDLSVVSGDPVLAAGALEGVRHWTFEPKRIDGNPVEAEVPICVAFSLLRGPGTPASSCAQTRDPQDVQPGAILSQVPPVYPPKARKKHIEGVVVLQATIGDDGTVQELNAVSGDSLLIPAALDAVRQWRYKPTLQDGKPVKVTTTIRVAFTLSPGTR